MKSPAEGVGLLNDRIFRLGAGGLRLNGLVFSNKMWIACDCVVHCDNHTFCNLGGVQMCTGTDSQIHIQDVFGVQEFVNQFLVAR